MKDCKVTPFFIKTQKIKYYLNIDMMFNRQCLLDIRITNANLPLNQYIIFNYIFKSNFFTKASRFFLKLFISGHF